MAPTAEIASPAADLEPTSPLPGPGPDPWALEPWAPAAWLPTAWLPTARSAAETEPSGAETEPSAAETEPSTPLRPAAEDRREQALEPLEPVRILGQLLVGAGLVLVLFAGFQLWGTGLLEWRAQRALAAEFERLVTTGPPPDPAAEIRAIRGRAAEDPGVAETPRLETPPPARDANVVPRPLPPGATHPVPEEGAAIGRIEIPSIGVDKTIVQGVERDTLRRGPGHYPSTPLPGRPGNAAIAGHRTTHGAPFFDLDRVEPGDLIRVETVEGAFTYEVEAQPGPDGSPRGFAIVDPSAVEVIGDHGDDRLTLTACHPRYSARQRIVVSALLVGEPATSQPVPTAPPPTTPRPDAGPSTGAVTGLQGDGATGSQGDGPAGPGGDQLSETPDRGATVGIGDGALDASLGWQADELDPTVMWATVTLLLVHVAWILGRLWRPRTAYLVAAPVIAVPLFACFVHLDRLLPAF